MTTTSNIAAKFNVLESAIVRVEEWASVMFCVVKGIGARFVSKKYKAREKKMAVDYKTEKYSELETIVRHFDTGAWVIVGTFNGLVVREHRGKGSSVTDEHRAYALAQAAAVKAKMNKPAIVDHTQAPVKPSFRRRTSCLNCGITNSILMGRGYCTDCHGECD
jgi:hypothetical protein